MAQCQTPLQLKERNKLTGEIQIVPCGKCPQCIKRLQSNWSFRLLQEEKRSDISHFVTLTYDQKNVPLSPAGYMTLRPNDLQLFFKRLRKKSTTESWPVKYYACGEYGKERSRPHYHAIIFNAEIRDIENSWGLGETHYGKVEGASIGYCLKYMLKKGKPVGIYEGDDRIKEFSRMSKGLGKCYLTENILQWYFGDIKNRMYVNLDGGKKASLPRYYKDKIFVEENFESVEHMEQIKKEVAYYQRIRMEKQIIENMIKNPDYTRDKAERDLQEWRQMEITINENLKI